MSSSDEGGSSSSCAGTVHKKYRGVRRRKWGKWVSEIRVPGTQERLWLGSYSTAEAAAVAHDVASYCLRGPSSLEKLNFPSTLPAGVQTGMSPGAIQKAASDAGMAVDARFVMKKQSTDQDNVVDEADIESWQNADGSTTREAHDQLRREQALDISVEDYLSS